MVVNDLTSSVYLDGVRAEEIKQALAADIREAGAHVRQHTARIDLLGRTLSPALACKAAQASLLAPAASTEVAAVVLGITEAADEAIAGCEERIDLGDGIAFVTRNFPVTTPGTSRATAERSWATSSTTPSADHSPKTGRPHPSICGVWPARASMQESACTLR